MMKKKFLKTVFLSLFFSCFISILCADDEYHDDWLHVNENAEIVDKDGNPVWLTGVNWFGFATGSNVFDGVWSRNMHEMLTEIADHGFNLMRVPVSTQILLDWKAGKKVSAMVNKYSNPELCDEDGTIFDSFRLFKQAVAWCRELGIKIMIDVHSAQTSSNGHTVNLWYSSGYSTEDWMNALAWFADYFKDDDTILAIDIKNEPHGKGDDGPNGAKWDNSKDLNNWKYAAEQCGAKILEQNPNLLIVVEGIEVYPKEGSKWGDPSVDYITYTFFYHPAWWGANFRGEKDYPLDFGKYRSQLVFSPHDYGPKVWQQDWFHEGFTSESIMEEYWYDTWFFILEEKIGPLLIGEWGGFMDGGDNEKWMVLIRDLMIKNRIHHTFWCFNENSGDTGGLVYDDFKKWDEEKYGLVEKALWKDGEKFIGLDHKIPLGANGISLGEYYGKK